MNDWIVWLLEFVLPRQYWYRNFYLRSKHWKSIRARKLKKSHNQCEKHIGMKGRGVLDVHHLTYKHMWNEKMSDLQVLCRECHKREHGQ